MNTRTQVDWKPWYRALREKNLDAYRRTIEHAGGVCLTHGLPLSVAADVERSHVMLACYLLDVTPRPEGT